MAIPRVSCLLVTQAGREGFVRRAVADFFAQRYPNKELVVIAEGPVPVPMTPGLTVVEEIPAPRPVLGDLRNRSLELATGDIVAIWDDDDRNDPFRLQTQVDHLVKLGVDACFLSRIFFKCLCGAVVVSGERLWECTMLARKSVVPQYNALPRREDSTLVERMTIDMGVRFAMLNQHRLFTKVFHGSNTWDAQHNRHLFYQATPSHTCEALRR